MSLNAFFSVIVPVYNKEKYVSRAISSILNQSFEDFELIIVCDPSTDNSNLEILKFHDSRIKIFNREIPGPGGYAARNLGIENSNGKWIAFLDADDEWYSNHLSEAYKQISNEFGVEIIFINFHKKCNGIISLASKLEDTKILNQIDSLKLYACRDFVNTNSIVVDRRLFVKAGLFPDGVSRRGGDSDLWLRLMLSTNKSVFSKEITSCYDLDQSGIVKNELSTSQKHPLSITVEKFINSKSVSPIVLKNLKRLSNRKSFAWSLIRKINGNFSFGELNNFYIFAFTFIDYLYFFLLLLPGMIVRLIWSVKQANEFNK
jgi:glycosyltransferase involved in cell wall biosynthesis